MSLIAEIIDFFGFYKTAARLRWNAYNAEKRRDPRCPCGQPGTVVRTSGWPVPGGVRPEFWHCDDHKDVPLTTPWSIDPDGRGTPNVQDEDGVWYDPRYER